MKPLQHTSRQRQYLPPTSSFCLLLPLTTLFFTFSSCVAVLGPRGGDSFRSSCDISGGHFTITASSMVCLPKRCIRLVMCPSPSNQNQNKQTGKSPQTDTNAIKTPHTHTLRTQPRKVRLGLVRAEKLYPRLDCLQLDCIG